MERLSYSEEIESKLVDYYGYPCADFCADGLQVLDQQFESRRDDVLVASYIGTETPWINAIIRSTLNYPQCGTESNYNPEGSIPILEFSQQSPSNDYNVSNISKLQSPRLLRSYLPYDCLPHTLEASDCRKNYITRNPKDAFVSLCDYLSKLPEEEQERFGVRPKEMNREALLGDFRKGKFHGGLFVKHVLSYWRQATNPCVYILTLEGLEGDRLSEIKRLANFVGRWELGEQQIREIVENCEVDCAEDGVVGKWKNVLSRKMINRLDRVAGSFRFRKPSQIVQDVMGCRSC
eukprot:Gb_16010 [translate_table: standard]